MADTVALYLPTKTTYELYKNGAKISSGSHASFSGSFMFMVAFAVSGTANPQPHIDRIEVRDDKGGNLLFSDNYNSMSAWTAVDATGGGWIIEPAGFAHTDGRYVTSYVSTPSTAKYFEYQGVTFDDSSNNDSWLGLFPFRTTTTGDLTVSQNGYRMLFRPQDGSLILADGTITGGGEGADTDITVRPGGIFRYPYEFSALDLDDREDFVVKIMDRDRALEDYVSGSAIGSFSHDDLTDISADQHHPQEHTHASDGSGAVAHSDTSGQTADDHHDESHAHDGADGSGTVSHDDLDDLTSGDPHTQYLQESLAAAKGDILAATANDTWAVLTVGNDDQVLTVDASEATGLKWADASGGSGGGGLKDFDVNTKQDGDVTLNSTSWANVDTGIDLTLDAAEGDLIEVGFSAKLGNEATEAYFDAGTLVSAAIVNVVSDGASESATSEEVAAWSAPASAVSRVGGSMLYTLQAGDIDSGSVVLRLRYRTASATNRTLEASANETLAFWATNHGVSSSTAIPASTLTAKGDLIVASAANTPAALTVGTDGQVLVADSGEDTGVKWGTGGSATWDDYTPTNQNISVGDGTQVARFWQQGDLVVVRYTLTWGSSTSFSGGSVEIGLPVAAAGGGTAGPLGSVYRLDAGTSESQLLSVRGSVASTSRIAVIRTSDGAALSSTVPHTWAPNDVLTVYVTYEAA